MADSSIWANPDDNVLVVGLADYIEHLGVWQGSYHIYLDGKLIYARTASGTLLTKEAAELEAKLEGWKFFEEEADERYRAASRRTR